MNQTPLDSRHRKLGARMVPFAGWEMPVTYQGLVEEHKAVRNAAGLFDLSHMGEFRVQGPEAGAGLDHALVSTPSRLKDGRAHYSMICAADGSVIDDLIVYYVDHNSYLVVANASNTATVGAALMQRLDGFEAELQDVTMQTALIAVQGPHTVAVLQQHVDIDLEPLRYYSIVAARVADQKAMVARTGYTGEDGFEIYLDWDAAGPIWDLLLESGRSQGMVAVGLGARDTLRLEAGMPLYGQELSRSTNPFEAGLGRVVKFDKPGDFVGRQALQQAAERIERKLVGLQLQGRGIARTGYPVYLIAAGEPVGEVTSGTLSPTLGQPIAMAYVPVEHGEPGTTLEVGIRDKRVPAEVVPLPFYRRST